MKTKTRSNLKKLKNWFYLGFGIYMIGCTGYLSFILIMKLIEKLF